VISGRSRWLRLVCAAKSRVVLRLPLLLPETTAAFTASARRELATIEVRFRYFFVTHEYEPI